MLYQLNELHLGLTYDEYHNGAIELQALRSTGLKPLLKSPLHYKMGVDQPRKESDALRVGKIVHSLFESCERFMETYVVEPEFVGMTLDGKESKNSKAAKEAKAQWYASLKKEQIVVYPEDLVMIQALARNISTSKEVKGLLRDSTREASVFAKDPETGVVLACRPDLIGRMGHVIDYKTTIDASEEYMIPQIFRNSKMSQFYILNAAHYAHVMKCAGVGSGESFTIIAIDKTIWDFQIFPLDVGCLAVGDQWRQIATRRYADALASGKWEGFKNKIVPVNIPTWVQVPEADQV